MLASVVVAVGNAPVCLSTTDKSLVELIEDRFGRFLSPAAHPDFHFDITVVADGVLAPRAELSVTGSNGRWSLERGDFSLQLDTRTRRGSVRQTLNPYAVDSVLRVVHTLILSAEGGFLLHASSVVRNGRAFLFTGPSGAGKTTIVGLAPSDVTLLTDEISYVRKTDGGYFAFGTPFSGDRQEAGEQTSAPIAAVYRLEQGVENDQERLGPAAAVRALMRNMLFFTVDAQLSRCMLDAACDFATAVPAFRLTFAPDSRVWSTIT
jgi:hypothetical protein